MFEVRSYSEFDGGLTVRLLYGSGSTGLPAVQQPPRTVHRGDLGCGRGARERRPGVHVCPLSFLCGLAGGWDSELRADVLRFCWGLLGTSRSSRLRTTCRE